MADDSPFGMGFFYLFIGGSVALIALTVVLLLGLTIVGGMAAGLGSTTGPNNVTSSPDPITGQAVSFASTAGNAEIHNVWSVNDSTGYAIGLTGAGDSYVQSKNSFTIAEDDTWSVSTWAEANATETMAAVSLDGRIIIQYNHSQSEWRGWYYDESNRNSYVASVAAPNQPGNLSLVTVTNNGTHMWMYANTTEGAAVNVTASNIESLNTSATNWNGTLDETRLYDDVTNDSEQTTLYNNPVAPRPERNRTGRLMYDEGQGETTAIYFTDTSATLSNAEWVDGLDGHELTSGVDYRLDQSAGEITALSNGRIDGAPVVWITYNYSGLNRIGQLAQTFIPAFELFSSSAILIPGVVVIGVLLSGIVYAIRKMDSDSGAFDSKRRNGR